MDTNLFGKANEIIKSCDVAYFGVIDENGYPHVSTVSTVQPENLLEAYFATGLNANKTKRLLQDKRASVCYRLEGQNITLVGEAEILTDQEIKSKYWEDWFIDHFPLGHTDPGYCIIKFKTNRVSLWIDCESAEFMIEELLTVQSRCGLLCNFCSFKELHNCVGCIETNGHPFHGKCRLASCCQDKGYTHCGECESLPDSCQVTHDNKKGKSCGGCKTTSCDIMYEYSHADPEHGDNPPGARIALCRAWASAVRR